MKIIHIDMDAFFAAVEERDFPEYAGKPLIVGGSPTSRGVVSTCNYVARKFGIHSAMPSARAYRLCPNAIFLRPRFDAYREASKQIREIFSDYTDLVEPLSLDEAYLDVSETTRFQGSATRVAEEIKKRIVAKTKLTASAGVSYNKFLAKIASDMDKPDGLTVVTPEKGPQLVANLAVGKFHGIGKATEAKMHRLEIYTGKDLKRCPPEFLLNHFGKAGSFYYQIARGIDERRVTPAREAKSISAETTFQTDLEDIAKMEEQLERLLERVLRRLNEKRLTARTVSVKIKYQNFQQITRSHTQNQPFRSIDATLPIVSALLRKTEVDKRRVRLLGVCLSTLRPYSNSDVVQLELF